MKKVLLYKDRIFLNARKFHTFIVENEFDGNEPNNFNLKYVAVCFSNKQKTIAGIKVDWVTIDLTKHDVLQKTSKGWVRYSEGADETFLAFVQKKNEKFTKEILWRWVVDFVSLYDLPRSRMNSLVDEVLKLSSSTSKKKGVKLYELDI